MTKISYMSIPGRPDVLTAICEAFALSIDELMSGSGKRKITEAKQAAMYLIKITTTMGPSAIGRMFNTDHSTVIYATKVVPNFIEADKDFRKKINRAKEILNIN